MEANKDWRTQLKPNTRNFVVNKLLETLKKNVPIPGGEGLVHHKKIALNFEENIFTSATSELDYRKKLSMKMLSLETKSQPNGVAKSTDGCQSAQDRASHTMQSQVHNQAKSQNPLPNPSHARQQPLPQNIHTTNTKPSATSRTQSTTPNAAGENQQTLVLRQQQTSTPQQPVLESQPQPHQQTNATNLQQNQLLGEQQQNNLANIQQQEQRQQFPGQQNNISNLHSLHQQNRMSELQQRQQKLLEIGTQSGVSNMKLQHEHSQPAQQQPMSQHQSQPTQMQQPNPLQRGRQQSIQTSASMMLNPQNVTDQKQVLRSQRALPEALSPQTGHNAVELLEEAYQKINSLREKYLPDLSETHQKLSLYCQRIESLSQPLRPEQVTCKFYKCKFEKMIEFLDAPKDKTMPISAEKLVTCEKQIMYLLNRFRAKKPVSTQQQIHSPAGHLLSIQQQHQQQLRSQIPQLQHHDNQVNSQMQPVILQNSVSSMQSTSVTGINPSSMPPLSNHLGVSTAQTMMNSPQPGSTLESGQGNTSSSLQQVGVGLLQKSSLNAPQQANVNTMSQGGVNGLQPSVNSLQLNPNMLQHPHLKEQVQQKQRQMHLQLDNQKQQQHPQRKQQLQQFVHQSQKAHQYSQLEAHQRPQLHQMNEDLKARQGMVFKPGTTATGIRTPSNHQPKAGASFPISSSLLQVASAQISPHSSPQIDQPSLLPSVTKTGTSLLSANSPSIVPSPSTPFAPSPIPWDSGRQSFGVSTPSNSGNIGQMQKTAALAQVPSLAASTPGVSASPLLAEFTGMEGNQATASSIIKSSFTEQPLERLIKVVESASPKALSASVSDIGSIISMIDRIAGSAHSNGSRAAVEDLAAITRCHMQAKNFDTKDGSLATKKMKRHISVIPLDDMPSSSSVNDSVKQLAGLESSDLESIVASRMKRPRFEANYVLLEEIRELNQRMIDTVVDISDEDVHPTAAEGGEGTIVKCSFNAVALSSNLKSQYASAQMSSIMPLRLLVPTNYPNCSPILLDKFPDEFSKDTEDLSVETNWRFCRSLRSLSQPMSLGQMVRTWDVCARAVINDYAQQRGGGSFSSRYGTWENCVSAT